MAVAGAYILFDEVGGEFAFDCLTGSIHGSCDGDAVQFSWEGNDEMEPTAMTSHSSHVVQRLLQQPARAPRGGIRLISRVRSNGPIYR
jgi:hypothetical protein